MSRRLILGVVAAALVAQSATAQIHYSIIFLPSEQRPWTVREQDPYAVWDARSDAPAGSEVALDRQSEVIDSAWLAPDNLYVTDRDLLEGSRVWLSGGSSLVKMHGRTANWWCTARFDDRSVISKREAAKAARRDFEYNLCLQADAQGHTFNPKIMIADFKGLMTITDQDSGMGQYRDGIGATGSITLKLSDKNLFPHRTRLTLMIDQSRHLDGSVCLKMNLTELNGQKPFLSREEACFSDKDHSVEAAGGRYTLTTQDTNGGYRVRIDRPIDLHGLSPRVIPWTSNWLLQSSSWPVSSATNSCGW